MAEVHSIQTPTHGRVLIAHATDAAAPGWIVAFHGYAQSADDAMADVMSIPGAGGWDIVAVQALHRFYSRGDENVIASWMTRQDRELAIADNVTYVDRVIASVVARVDAPVAAPFVRPIATPVAAPFVTPIATPVAAPVVTPIATPAVAPVAGRIVAPGFSPASEVTNPLVFVGFSQGAAMAYRAAQLGRHRAAGVIALGGDIPPEIRTASESRPWPAVLIGAGDAETWYTAEKVRADVEFLESRGVAYEVVRYRGGHAWTDEFRAAAGDWLRRLGVTS